MKTVPVPDDLDSLPRLKVSEFRSRLNDVNADSGPVLVVARDRPKFVVVPVADIDELTNERFAAAMGVLRRLMPPEAVESELAELEALRDSEGTVLDLAEDLDR
jgi:prevent-host-death family protein